MTEFSLRAARPGDVERLFEIHQSAMRAHVSATWGWDDAWQAAHFREHFDPQIRQVICCGERTIGFLDVVHAAHAVRLQSIEIESAHQGRGIGTELIRRLIADADHQGLAVELQVLKINTRARVLYERLGFVRIGETETHLQMRYA